MQKNQRWMAAVAVWLAGAGGALAADGGSAGAVMSLGEMMQAGGWLMYVLGAMSVAGLAFAIYLGIVLRQDAVVPRELMHDLTDALSAGRQDEARVMCRRSRTPLSAIADSVLAFLQRHPRPDPTVLRERMEGEGSRQAALIQNQTQYLLDIAVIAPMVGLLGTVFGMLQAFGVIAHDLQMARPMLLAEGVAKALITTAAGLIIGIPAMAVYAYFRNKVTRLTALLETASADLLSLLQAPPETRAEPRLNP